MAIAGIPALVNEFGGGTFMETRYHSQFDNDDAYDETVYHYHHVLYGRLMLAFDQLCLPPLDYTVRLAAISETLNCQRLHPRLEGAFRGALMKATEKTEELYGLTEEINRRYALKQTEGNLEAKELYAACREARLQLLDIFRYLEDHFVRLTWHDVSILPHEHDQHSVEMLHKAVWQLHAGDVKGAVQSLGRIDNNCYAADFDRDVYDYFTGYVLNQPSERLLWGAGRVQGHLDLYDLIHGLREKSKTKKPDLSLEIRELMRLEQDALSRLDKTVREETAALEELEQLVKKALRRLRPYAAPRED
jgi:hypothetical protein